MFDPDTFDAKDWFSRWDMEALAPIRDKVNECAFFFNALSQETKRDQFRWLVSAFLNSAYSFFESSALTAYFRYTDHNGEPYEDSQGLDILRKHVKVTQRKNNPEYVTTEGQTLLTKQLYEFRKKSTHHLPLSIMIRDNVLPEGFQFGSMRDEGVPVMPLCREVMALIQKVDSEIND